MMAKFTVTPVATLQILISALCLVCLLPFCTCQGQIPSPVLISTESTITLQWNVEANATFYLVTWHRSVGLFLTDEYYHGPFEDKNLTLKITDLLPGVSYSFLLFKNGNHTSNRIFKEDITTVPLPPENLQVLNRTSDSLLLTWDPGYNSTQDYYEVEYHMEGDILTVVANSSTHPLTFNLTQLMPGHVYSLSMRAVSGSKRSNSSVAVPAVTAPAMPGNFNVTATGTHNLQATWEAGNNSLQDSFEVWYSLNEGKMQINTNCTASPCEFDVKGAPGALYTVYVYALRQAFRSIPAVRQHNSAPAPPRNLNGVGGIRSLHLTWEVPAQGDFNSFHVILVNTYKNSEKVQEVMKNGDVTAYSLPLTDLVGGVNFFVRVFTATLTEYSRESASHLYFTLPESVSSLFGQAVNTTTLQLSWQNPYYTEYTGLQLNLTAANGFEQNYNLGVGASSLAVAGLDPGREYTATVVVRAVAQTDSAPVSIPARTKPEPPRLTAVTIHEESIEITLTGGQNPQGLFDSINAKLVEIGTPMTTSAERALKFPNLTPGTQFTLDAFTVSGNQTSDHLVQVLFTKPRPPQNLHIEVLETELYITWQPPDKGGVDNYTVILVPSHGEELALTGVVSENYLAFNETHPGETYNVSVVANKGTVSSSPIVAQQTTTPLPLQHVLVSMKGTDFAVVSWDSPSGSVFDGFAYSFSFLNKTLTELGPDTRSVNFEPLAPDSNYTVMLYTISYRVDGAVLYSEPTAFNFSTYPESVAALQKVNATSNSITVNWTSPLSGSFSGFQVGINPPDGQNAVETVSSTVRAKTFTGLQAGKNYSVAIRTVSGISFGVAVRLQVVTNPLPVDGLVVETVSAEALRVSWMVNVNKSTQDHFNVLQDRVQLSQSVQAVMGQSAYTVELKQLLPGHMYTVSVIAVRKIETDIGLSQPQLMNGTTKPLPVVNLTVTGNKEIVTVTWAPAATSMQKSYLIRHRPTLRDANAPWQNQTSATSAIQFSQVFPGEKYEISVFAISNGQESDASRSSIIVAPLAPKVSLDLNATTTTTVTLTWTHDPTLTYVNYWLVHYKDAYVFPALNVSIKKDSNNYRENLTQLTPGMTYAIDMVAVVQNTRSEKVMLNATAKPSININIQEITSETTSTELVFEYQPSSSDIFDSFRFTLLGSSDSKSILRVKNDPKQKVQFTQLTPGHLYTVKAVAISAGVESDAIFKNILTVPTSVNVSFQNDSDKIVLNFTSQVGGAAHYEVNCYTASNSSCLEGKVPANSSGIIIKNLQPYAEYTIRVRTVATGADVVDKSVAVVYNVRTSEAAPSEVRQVTAVKDGLHSVQLSWLPPLKLNGKLRSYHLEYIGSFEPRGVSITQEKEFSPSTTSQVVTNLKAGYYYVFKIKAMTVAFGQAAETSITLPTDVPGFKIGNTASNGKPVQMTESAVTETSFFVKLYNAFSDEQGPIIGYSVIVSTDPLASTSQAKLPSWSDRQADRSITVYQVMDKCPDLFQQGSLCGKSSTRSIRAAKDLDSVTFQLGAQPAEDCSPAVFCNGPLVAGTDYYVKLRAFTSAGFTDTDFSSQARTADAPQNSNVLTIVVVAVVVVLIIIAIVIGFVVFRLKRRPKRATKYCGTSGAARSSWESSSLKNFRDSTADEHHTSRPVKLHEFPDHVRKMAADSDFRYAEEYEDLKEVGRDQTCYAAELPANRPKNRFTNILPYDHSRVKLLQTDDEEGSDYINANYIPGYNSKREYIATQGPLPATRDDFWRMVWEQNTRNIVMLTRCTEKGREKSDHYWPTDSEPKFYGDLQVIVLNETHMPEWTITEFKICLGDICRQVRHFHYKAWPDFGVPKNHSSLIRFVRTVREKLIKEGGPIVTHCSAGVGRSGTCIVLDHCLQLAKEKDEVDIFSIVYNLRRERVLMVQTEQQYKFIHECLSCVLEGREDETIYANTGLVNVGFEDDILDHPNPHDLHRKSSLFLLFDDEGINEEIPT